MFYLGFIFLSCGICFLDIVCYNCKSSLLKFDIHGDDDLGYTKDYILNKCRLAFDDKKAFYKKPFINYDGRTNDTNEYYTEVVAEFLCNNISEYINGIPKITRETSYKTVGHDGNFDINTPREEERIAMEMFLQSKRGIRYDYIGVIFDYQTPLKNKHSDKVGKIDLLSYDGNTLYILELKKPDSDESMLRCVLEGFTYMQTADKEKLLQDFKLPSNTVIKACPFVFKDKLQHRQMTENRPHLFRLMKLLDTEAYYIKKENSLYIVEK